MTYKRLRKIKDAVEPLTVVQAKQNLNIDPDFVDDDALLGAMIGAARDYCEQFCNRFLVASTVVVVYDGLPTGRTLGVPVPDLATVESLSYYTEALDELVYLGTLTLDTDLQTVFGEYEWPSATAAKLQVTTAEPAELDGVRQAMQLLIADMYELRTATTERAVNKNPAVAALLWPYRVELGM